MEIKFPEQPQVEQLHHHHRHQEVEDSEEEAEWKT
jgi:hypothetical protein